MRPVRRGDSPQATDFADYTAAKPFLVSRLGHFCSYCERRVATNLAVEHVQPKGLPAYAALAGRWENFLLGCVNCNSTKGDRNVVFVDTLMPDRDNTAVAFDYLADGSVRTSASLTPAQQAISNALLTLVGLDNPISTYVDENGKQVALDRVAQRLEVWGIAQEALRDVVANPGIDAVKRQVVNAALGHGFFSIWMIVFAADADMRRRLIDAFPGTNGSGCFDPIYGLPVQPAPNPDHLADGGKL
ncbi:MAG: HNH endonuclease [Sphingomonadales bacterium]|jgi:uncharacterized protein (TIGR02646 family)|nr:HNH endonuclease [Sphingomonadales bacterium]TXI79675.1 MAG: HNH endonuclease [Flavobacteriales bacterium]